MRKCLVMVMIVKMLVMVVVLVLVIVIVMVMVMVMLVTWTISSGSLSDEVLVSERRQLPMSLDTEETLKDYCHLKRDDDDDDDGDDYDMMIIRI